MPTNLTPSIVRTLVPLLVGWLLALPITGPVVEFFGADPATAEAWLTSAVASVLAAAYYVAARLAEVYVRPRLGWLLGLPSAPSYDARHRAGDDTGAAAVLPVLAAAALLLLVAAVPAAAHATRPAAGTPTLQVPLITAAHTACDDDRTLLDVRVLGTDTTGRTWTTVPDGAAWLRVEAWADGQWRSPRQASAGEPSVLAGAPGPLWRPYLVDGRGRRTVTGPEAYLPVPCSAAVPAFPAAAAA